MMRQCHATIQPSNMTLKQYTDDLFAESCKVADVYDDSTLKDVFIKGVDPSIKHSLRIYCATNSQVDLTDFAFQTRSLLSIQKKSGKF